MIHVDIRGSGRELVFLHGAPQGPYDLEPLVAPFRVDHRVALVHLPGYGDTPPIESDYDMVAVARELADELAAAGITSPVLVGMSAGAYRCLELALEPGDMSPRGLFLIGPFAELEEPEREGFRGFGVAMEAGADLLDLAVARLLGRAWVEAHPDVASRVAAHILKSVDRRGVRAEFDAFADSADLLERASDLDIPTYLRVGEEDQATPVVHAERLAARLPDTTLEVVPGRGHLLHHEDLEATLEALRGFVTTRCRADHVRHKSCLPRLLK
ncbi:MAG: alpha/beta hydrolase [Deltaproteobacteria bacterium]|nr:alpha/beta hydrolase [Deltaproteobacteria bacterium]